ncbi:MAG: hypothetical protein ACE5FL_16830, partial [Myxococcota bacterium]
MAPPDVTLVKLFVGSAATALLLAGVVLRRLGEADRFLQLRDAALALLGVVGALCWWNLFQLEGRGFVQGHEQFHYFVGAKYFRELGYTRLYACTAVADANAVPREHLEGWLIRDLASNRLVPIGTAIDHPERCTAHFDPPRWREFQQDVAWFRDRITPWKWRWLVMDHGYNAPPAWGVLAIPIANFLDVSASSIVWASRIDPLLQLVMWGVVAWAFGWRVLCVALIFWGTNGLGEFSFVGGGYLRQDWLCAAVAGLCALRREKHLAAGVLLATAALLRLIPIVLILAFALGALIVVVRERSWRPAPAHRRFAAGCGLALLIFVPLSGVTSGFESWPRFVENIRLHRGTPLLNNLGLRTLASYDSDNAIPDDFSNEKAARWKRGRDEAFSANAWWMAVGGLLFAALLARAAARSPGWVAAVLGVGAAVIFLEVTAYYYALLIAYALLSERDGVAGPVICGFAVLSLALSA